MATITSNLGLAINGVVPNIIVDPANPTCPPLDPLASIQISDELIGIYQSRIDALINQLGKNILLKFEKIRVPCPNCWTSGSMISTPYGYTAIEDITINDLVLTPHGNVQKVTGLMKSMYDGNLYNIQCYGVNLNDYMTAKHRLLVVKNLRDLYTQKQWYDKDFILQSPRVEAIEAQNIELGDALIIPEYYCNNEPLQELEIDGFGLIKIDNDFLNFLGWWLAEGCLHKSKCIREGVFCLCASKENHIADYLMTIAKNKFNLRCEKEFRKDADNLLVHFYSVHLAQFLEKFGLGAENKQIPQFLWKLLSYEQLNIIMKAYHSGDGNVFSNKDVSIKNRYSIGTTSKILAHQIFHIVSYNKYSPSIQFVSGNIDKNGVNHKDSYVVTWYPDRTQQKSCVRQSSVGLLSKIHKIHKISKQTIVYNIEVENDHEYIVNNIASKNCTFDTMRGRSTGIHIPGGPRPFARGRRCPWCKGNGFEESNNNKCIKALLKWNPKESANYGIDLSDSKGIVRIKTFLTEFDDLRRAITIIVNHDMSSIAKLRVKLVRGPIPVGLREDRYCISFWELLDE